MTEAEYVAAYMLGQGDKEAGELLHLKCPSGMSHDPFFLGSSLLTCCGLPGVHGQVQQGIHHGCKTAQDKRDG